MTNWNRPPRFARNAFASGIAFLFVAITGFFLSPYVVEHLGATRYGVWSLIAGLVGYLALLDLGIRQAVNRYSARHHAAGAHEESSLIISAALRLFGFLGILAIILSGVLAYFAPMVFNIPEGLANETRAIIVLGGLTIAVSLVTGVFGGVVTGLERFDIYCYLEILVTSIRTVAFVYSLRVGHGLIALASIQLSVAVFNCILHWAVVRRLYAELRIRLWAVLGPQMRTILSFGASLTMLYALGKILFYSDSLVIGAILPIEAVAFFAIAGTLCANAKDMSAALAVLMTPRISALMSTGSNRVGGLVVTVAKIATLASAPIAVTFVLRGESFISIWMGPAYGPQSGVVLQILAVVVWLDASRSVAVSSLTGMAKQSTIIPGFVVEAASNLTLSLALIQPFGIAGVALGTLIPNVLVTLGYIPRCVSKATGVPVSHFCRHAILLPTVACLPFGLATVIIERLIPATNLAVFFFQTILILPLVPLTAWIFCLTAAERGRVKSEIGRIIKR